MTQDDLARELGVSKQTISNYERNKRKPGYEELEAIADIFNVPMGFFLSEQEQREKLNQIYKSYNTLNRGKEIGGERVVSLEQASTCESSLSAKSIAVARAYDQMSGYGKAIIDAIITQENLHKHIFIANVRNDLVLDGTGRWEVKASAISEQCEPETDDNFSYSGKQESDVRVLE